MVTLNKIYTRTGDKGDTALGDGSRRTKDDARVDAYGTVDELNAAVGLTRLHTSGDMDAALARIQNDLFDLGADLCRPDMEKDADAEYPPLRMIAAQTERLEQEIDSMNRDLAPLKSFILPGGSAGAAHMHLARTTARRAERKAVTLSGSEDVNSHAIKYLNRLSDWFFVASRVLNDNGDKDVLWVPGANR